MVPWLLYLLIASAKAIMAGSLSVRRTLEDFDKFIGVPWEP